MRVTIGINFRDFVDKYKEIVLFSILRMEDVLSSNYFLEMLADEISNSNGLEGELSKWKHASIEEIYAQLFPIKLNLNTYYTFKDVIGYGMAGDNNIFLNTKYLNTYKIEKPLDLMHIGSNLLHEHSHDCGFEHDFYATDRRPNSISYVLNRAYERAYRKFYQLPEPIIRKNYSPWYKRLIRWMFS